jgi:HSP20 family protein
MWGIQPEDWLKKLLSSSMPFSLREALDLYGDLPRQFEQMRRAMEREFEEQFRDVETKVPKELVREYQTTKGNKVREVGPIVYGYSVTVGADGKPKVQEFGNIRSPSSIFKEGLGSRPLISSEIEPLSDVMISDKEVKVVVELPGIDKKDIRIKAHDNLVEISTTDAAQRKYKRTVELPEEANIEIAKSTYKNGILEITFDKKAKQKGKQINIE